MNKTPTCNALRTIRSRRLRPRRGLVFALLGWLGLPGLSALDQDSSDPSVQNPTEKPTPTDFLERVSDLDEVLKNHEEKFGRFDTETGQLLFVISGNVHFRYLVRNEWVEIWADRVVVQGTVESASPPAEASISTNSSTCMTVMPLA